MPIVGPFSELIALASPRDVTPSFIQCSHHAPRDVPPTHHSKNDDYEWCLLNPKRIKRPELRRKSVVVDSIARQFRRRCQILHATALMF